MKHSVRTFSSRDRSEFAINVQNFLDKGFVLQSSGATASPPEEKEHDHGIVSTEDLVFWAILVRCQPDTKGGDYDA